jgi:hypothetical protein
MHTRVELRWSMGRGAHFAMDICARGVLLRLIKVSEGFLEVPLSGRG